MDWPMRVRLPIARLLAALALCLVLVAPAVAYDVMLDASGSMQGFKEASGDAWTGLLNGLESGARRTYYFGDRTGVPNSLLAQVRLNHENTRLDEALQRWLNDSLSGDSVIIITDNIADERS